jgi:hypothetical protein
MLSTTLSVVNIPPSELPYVVFMWQKVIDDPRNFTYEDVHVDGIERIADAVAKYDVDRFIHVSSYNARRDSPSEYFATKVSGFSGDIHKRSTNNL